MAFMEKTHFPATYIDDIAKISTENNYFSPIWRNVVGKIGIFKNMLDVGCGNGIFSLEAKRITGCTLHGVDGSDYALQQAQNIGFDTLSPISDFNVDPLPFDQEQFDFCLCKDLLEHLLRPDFILEEIYRVLKPGGKLLVHVPNHFPFERRLRFLFFNDIDTFHYFPESKRWNFPHIRFFTHSSLLELLEQKGFRIVLDLSYHFPAIPYGKYLIPIPTVRNWIIKKYPSQFLTGFTLLSEKC